MTMPPNVTEWNAGASDFLRQAANDIAQQTYNNARLAGESDDRALARAKFEWQKKMDEAYQTGMWNGQWSNPQEQWFTGQFGQWYGPGGAPQAGDQTLTAQQQYYNQAYQNSQLYGQYYAPGTAPLQGMQTQQAINQANAIAARQAELTGWYSAPVDTNVDPGLFGKQDQATQQQYLQYNNNDPQAAANKWATDTSYALRQAAAQNPNANRVQTLAGNEQQFTQGLRTQQEQRAAQAQQQQQTQAYLSLLASLRGPADWAKYQQVLGSTPGGMRDLAAAAMGQYVPGGGATTGVQPQAASLQSLQGDISGQPYYGQGGGQLGQPNVYQGGQGSYGGQQQAGPQYQTGYWQGGGQPAGGWGQAPSANETWGSGLGTGKQQATPQQQQQAQGGGTNMYGGQSQQYNLPAPNQVAMQSWKNFTPSQQQLALGQWESAGWDKSDVQALMNQSLPRYASNASRAGTWRLQ